MKHIYRYLLLICIPLVLLSCVKDEDDIFDESAVNRMSKALKEYTNILASAENGWLMKYYIGEEPNKNGGFNLIVKFDKSGEATITSEYYVGIEKTSLYSVISDQGPILTFDTYNPIIHEFAEPQGSPYTDEGDYEFILQEVSADRVKMKGKKYGNTIIMTPFDTNKTWAGYLTDVNEIIMSSDIFTSYKLFIDGKETGIGYIDTEWERLFRFKSSDNNTTLFEQNIIYNSYGFEFFKPIEYAGKTFQHFEWDATKETFTCTDNVDVKLVFYKLPNYLFYEELLGDYKLLYNNNTAVQQTRDITIEPLVYGKSFKVTNFFPMNPITMTYSKSGGALDLASQFVTFDGGYPVYLFPWNGGSSLNTSLNSGLYRGSYIAGSSPYQVEFVSHSTSTNIGFVGIVVINGSLSLYSNAFYTNMKLVKK